jgi:RimJ/RimL family protein N-acetyltransferase
MTYLMRGYLPEESELACDVRGLIAQESRDRFKKRLESGLQWTDHYCHLALDRDGQLVGDVQLRHCDKTMPNGVAHIGIDIAESERGKGAGTSALELAWTWAKNNGFHRLEGSTDITNVAMRRAFEKAGWNFEGTLKNLFIEDGVSHDYLSFAITT